MPDREKVIKELHDARRYLEDKEWSDRGASPHIDAINDVLALLKEQEAVEPKAIRMNAFGHPVYACGKCGHLITESMNYCHECGKRIKWEGR